MALTNAQVKQAKQKKKTYRLSDEKGMYLEVSIKGSKYWRLKYRFGGKEKRLALGVYPEVSLKDARDQRDEARKQLASGIDPSGLRRLHKMHQTLASENSFEAIGREWFERKMHDRSESHRKRTERILEKDIYPLIGGMDINKITAPDLLAVIRRIEDRGAVNTARKANQAAGMIFQYAIITGRGERNPSADLRGALRTQKVKHLSSITDPKELGKLLLAMEGFRGSYAVKAALTLSPLFFCRPGELRHMEWAEIDWKAKQWEIPEYKMKMGFPHIVPLAIQAIEVLREQQQFSGHGKYVFPSPRGASRPLSDNAVRIALRAMGYDKETITPHGFRATARTILDEVLGFPVDWIEHQLAHTVKDANGRAYNRTTHIKQRRDMMQKWADYLDGLKATA